MRRSNSARPSVGFASLTWRQRLAYLRAWLWCLNWRIHCQHFTDRTWDYRPTITGRSLTPRCDSWCRSESCLHSGCDNALYGPHEVVAITATDDEHSIVKVFWEKP